MYEMTGEIPFISCGADNRLKLPAAVEMMMNCCQFQEYQEKDFCAFLRQNKIAVFLFSIQIDILRVPEFREKVKTAVKIYGCKSIYGLRRLTIRDEQQKICMLVNATGAFFDTVAKKALKLDVNTVPLKFDEPEPMECLPRKIILPQVEEIPCDPMTVRVTQLDPNGHLTSPLYFSAAQDILPSDFPFNRVRVEFKKQACLNETIRRILYLDGTTATVRLCDDSGVDYAVAEFSTISMENKNE